MLIAGLIVLLFILGLFLQALTSGPKADAEWQSDTDGEFATTPAAHSEEESTVIAA